MRIDMKDCDISNNGGNGVSLGPGVRAKITGGTISGNGAAGIWASSDAEAELRGVTISENTLDGVVVDDALERIRRVNPALVGITHEQLVNAIRHVSAAPVVEKRRAFIDTLLGRAAAGALGGSVVEVVFAIVAAVARKLSDNS